MTSSVTASAGTQGDAGYVTLGGKFESGGLVITSGTLVFLDQDQYAKQVGVTAMSDFRYLWKGDLMAVWVDMKAEDRGEGLSFILQAVKPSRCDR